MIVTKILISVHKGIHPKYGFLKLPVSRCLGKIIPFNAKSVSSDKLICILLITYEKTSKGLKHKDSSPICVTVSWRTTHAQCALVEVYSCSSVSNERDTSTRSRALSKTRTRLKLSIALGSQLTTF